VLTADPSLGTQLSEVKAGGHVKVSYKKNSSGQMIATKIAPACVIQTMARRGEPSTGRPFGLLP
jgi:hypothetical protein